MAEASTSADPEDTMRASFLVLILFSILASGDG